MFSPPTQPQQDSSPVKRLACDRCHDQKLRCTRPQDGEPCVRCQRAGVLCNVSVAQRTGRPRKSSNNRPQDERKTTPNRSSSATGGSLENRDKKMGITRTKSTESMSEGSFDSTPLPDSYIPMSWEVDAFASNSLLSISPALLPIQPYNQQMSTDEYADLLECTTDQAYFDNMDLSDFSDTNFTPNFYEPNPKKRKSNTQQFYTDQVSMSPPVDDGFSARISSFPDMEMPTISPAITTLSSTAGMPDLMAAISPPNDSTHAQKLSKLQSEIETCSESITHQARRMSTPSTAYSSEGQKLSEALGVLLSTAERFIELITCICKSSDSLVPSRSSSPSPWYQPDQANGSFGTTNRPFSALHSHNNTFSTSLDPGLLLGGAAAAPESSSALSTSTFYTMLKCHVRLLSAYDATLDAMSSRLLELAHLDMHAIALTSALSIGSFVVPYGAIIETLLHLQVISHQLHRLKTALHGNLLKLQPPRQQQQQERQGGGRSIPSRLGLCRQAAGRSPSVSMIDFKLEEIHERERALQAKLLRIENLAESSKLQEARNHDEEGFTALWA
ncbi:uncharacterized protein L3040_001418 [Drepanopeziza brunnea f. sp. 'multigermtubi']|uniref:C6 zinc finger domain protein n=1 Tax=Marssonina brunnea f. sp. multigermtubi (strain MB_m1) TaxID=1072389 RepID=K1XVI5_MARBU|nr:C6 zinc finger domain protein [Drepanopeziza brunnea f. sp. 'multigermtubi' MB_m1]EKD16679.1 C6 zinc finger domain protein [Drepanopeziza brunnea f. sp. 'multigermtubi' MB_m1]KAJ5051643.1 hypothetical protein L3040_001418 [Drepanopeziza brunnea f. sp. 'multigermtubi']